MTIRNSILYVFALLPLAAYPQADSTVQKWVDNTMMLGIGSQTELDTYLSSREYSGFTARFVSHTVRHKATTRWATRVVHVGQFFNGDMKGTDDGNEIGGIYNFQWGRQYSLPIRVSGLEVSVGATADLAAGFLYNTRNSNNPAQARLAINIGPVAAARYTFHLWQKPFALGLEMNLPVCGLMFSPNYGQSYYEIFSQGNYDHNIVPTTIMSTPSLTTMLSLDIPVGRDALRIGYIGDFQQSRINQIKRHSYCHYLMIGYSRSFSLERRRVVNHN